MNASCGLWRFQYIFPRYHRILSVSNGVRGVKWKTNFSTASENKLTNFTTTIETNKTLQIRNGPGLKDFITDNVSPSEIPIIENTIPYLKDNAYSIHKQKVFFEVYGCQMNVNDTEVVWSILQKSDYTKTEVIDEADVILIMTCAIRESAESKIWNRLKHLRSIKRKRYKTSPVKIGILGCMAERLKHRLLEKEQIVDIVAGPDSYKDLPRLLAVAENNQTAVNVLLSLDETYADVMPVRLNNDSKTAFVTIMRGCDNMCTYCIVPFTRGRERSRHMSSIVEEIKHLSEAGVKEVTLLGQNVNSYRDLSESNLTAPTKMAEGFKTVYKTKVGGLRFADLLDQVSSVDPEMRIRFTSPHPKDFPDEVLHIINERPNICKSLHLPAQSGSSAVLERMRRGYNREAYLNLVIHIRNILPEVSLSSDFICGFCHETDEEFEETLSLMEIVKYNVAYLFPYSMREKTTAHRRYVDDISDDVKHERLERMVKIFRQGAEELNLARIGKIHLILVEGTSKRSEKMLAGRNDGNIKVLIPNIEIPLSENSSITRSIVPGDFVAVQINSATSQTLTGTPLFITSITSFNNMSNLRNATNNVKHVNQIGK